MHSPHSCFSKDCGFSSPMPDCSYDQAWRAGRKDEFFWMLGVATAVVSILGVCSNLLTLTVLCRSELRKKVFYNLLIALACFDLVFIVSYGVLLSYDEIRWAHLQLTCYPTNDNVYAVTYPLLNICLTGSIYMTVAISLERYLGVCHPMVRKKSRLYIVSVCVYAYMRISGQHVVWRAIDNI